MKTYNERIEELKKKKFGRKFDDFRRMVRNINKEKASKRCKPFHIVKDLGLVSVHKQKAFFELYEDFCRNNAKIEQLNELRKEAIEEVKEISKWNENLLNTFNILEGETKIPEGNDALKYSHNKGVIDYLKAKFNITDKELE